MADKNTVIESGYIFDFSGAKFEYFDAPENHVQGLSSVDFLVETETHLLFIEVKNPDNPKATEAKREEFLQTLQNNELMAEIGRKFKDSLLRKYAEGFEFAKPVKYIFILQFDRYYASQRNSFRKSIVNDYIPAKKLNSEQFKAFPKFDGFEMPNVERFSENYNFPIQEIK
jgi:hypothetical protein